MSNEKQLPEECKKQRRCMSCTIGKLVKRHLEGKPKLTLLTLDRYISSKLFILEIHLLLTSVTSGSISIGSKLLLCYVGG